MKLSVSEASKITGVSVRTLHYYDEIGLLKPSEVSESGYRYYDGENISRLQQILFYRELELPLGEIAVILKNPSHDRTEALKKHRNLLLLKKRRIAELLALVNHTLGDDTMGNDKILIENYESAQTRYADEAHERWGNTDAYRESEHREKTKTSEETASLMRETEAIFKSFSALTGKNPESPEAQELVERWKNFITAEFYSCSNEILAELGEMYVSDPRFTKNLDKYGAGTAELMSGAIKTYCERQRQ